MPVSQLTLIFAFLAMAFWGVGDFLIQRIVKRVGDFQTLLWIDLIAGFFLIPFVASDLPAILTWPNVLSLMVMTVIYLWYGIFLFKAYNKGKLAVVEVIMIGELPFTIILGLIFFREKLDLSQVLVILLIISGTLLISKSRMTWWDRIKDFFTGKRVVWEKGVLLATVAVVFSALYNFLTAVNSRNISAFIAVWFPWMLSSLFLLTYIVYKKGLKSFWQTSLNYKYLILFTGIIDTAAWVFYAFATENGKISVVTTIVTGYAVIALILGVKFNKERISGWQYLGAILVFFGVAIMSFIGK